METKIEIDTKPIKFLLLCNSDENVPAEVIEETKYTIFKFYKKIRI